MKTYNHTNFFKHTFCEFTQVKDFEFPEKTNYKSKSDSQYFYTPEGVYRKSNHWGRVANCNWSIRAKDSYKNQTEIIGFAKWTDFYPTSSTEKLFWIAVDFELQQVKIKPKSEANDKHLLHLSDARKRVKDIRKLFLEEKWARYFEQDITALRQEIITQIINSNKTLQEIKRNYK